MKKFFNIFLAVLVWFQFSASFAEGFNDDLSLIPDNTYFSVADPIVWQKIRVYATIENTSKQDLFWYVRFYDEKLHQQIWKNEDVSIIAWRSDDVFVDWVIIWYWKHTISARVVPQKTSWDNPANNKVSKTVFVDFDSDWDWIPDRKDSDDDNDWIPDVDDLFPKNSRESADCDWDWIWNNADVDDDNDGVKDADDAFSCDPKEWEDTDWDWIWDNLDPDDDNDWLLDIEETKTDPKKWDTDWDWINDKDDLFANDKKRWVDTDWDWISNFDDPDDDNDWVSDDQDAFPLDKTEAYDTDWDWIWNNKDLDDDWDWWTDKKEYNTWTNPLKKDTDWDWHIDPSDAFPLNPKEWVDTDWDLIWNNADPDDDNDWFPDEKDDFPLDKKEWKDCDHDWIWNNADPDDDNDWVNDEKDAFKCDPTEWKDSDLDWIWDNKDQFDFNKAPKFTMNFSPKKNLKVWDEINFTADATDDDWTIAKITWKINWEEFTWSNIFYKFPKAWFFIVKCTVQDNTWEKVKKEMDIFIAKSDFVKNFLIFILILFILIFFITLRKKWFKVKHFGKK